MVDFRKALLVLLVLVFTAGLASAQLTSPLSCTANAGVPPPVRSEGLAEEIGQITITCSGGTPTAAGVRLPTVNVTLMLNTNVASRLLTNSTSGLVRSEALLLIDEPKPVGAMRNTTDVVEMANDTDHNGYFNVNEKGTQLVAETMPLADSNVPYALGGGVYGGGLSKITAVVDGVTVVTNPARPNVFVGLYNLSNPQQSGMVQWLNVPFDPPGTTNNRVLRIVNVRAQIKGSQLPASSTLVPTSVSAYLMISGTGGLALSQQTLTVAYVQKSLDVTITHPSNPQLCLAYDPAAHYFNVNFKELFGTAFRQKLNAAGAQNIPGTIYNTESMFYNPAFYNDGTQAADAGLASWGTKLNAKFANIPAGVKLYVPITITNSDGDSATLVSDNTWTNLLDSNGVAVANMAVVTLDSNRAGSITYEMMRSVPGFISTLTVKVQTDYSKTATPDVVGVAAGFYAPQSSQPFSIFYDPSVPATGVPRFNQTLTEGYGTAVTIKSCQTNLLFPWVAYMKNEGWDTGFAIANTTSDLWKTTNQRGTCSLNWFSAQGNQNFPATPYVEAGTVYTFTMSRGDAAGVFKGFSADYAGYMIASCNFQMAHAYAYLSNGVTAEGYLALVLDGDMFTGRYDGTDSRTHVYSEKLVH